MLWNASLQQGEGGLFKVNGKMDGWNKYRPVMEVCPKSGIGAFCDPWNDVVGSAKTIEKGSKFDPSAKGFDDDQL